MVGKKPAVDKLGKLIDEYCLRNSITYTKLAGEIGVTGLTITRWRMGSNPPSESSLRTFLNLAGISRETYTALPDNLPQDQAQYIVNNSSSPFITHTQEQGREGLYEQLVEGAQNLTRRVSNYEGVAHFEDFIGEHNSLLEKFILNYDNMRREDSQRVGYLLNQTKAYLHGALDVQRVRDIRNVLEENVKNQRLK